MSIPLNDRKPFRVIERQGEAGKRAFLDGKADQEAVQAQEGGSHSCHRILSPPLLCLKAQHRLLES